MSSIRTPLTVSPHEYFGDITGRPLDYGTIYFGEPDKDPEFYPIDVYADEALTQPIPQPIRTKGGFINVNGDMIEIYGRPAIYSVKVLDQYGRKIFYKGKAMRNNVNDDIIAEIDAAIKQSKDDGVEYAKKVVRQAIDETVTDNSPIADTLIAVDGSLSQRTINKGLESIADLPTIKNPKDGLRIYVKFYHAGLNKGGGYFVYDSSKANINNQGTIIDGWVREPQSYIDMFAFGGDSYTGEPFAAIQAAIDNVFDGGIVSLEGWSGIKEFDGQFIIDKQIKLYGNKKNLTFKLADNSNIFSLTGGDGTNYGSRTQLVEITASNVDFSDIHIDFNQINNFVTLDSKKFYFSENPEIHSPDYESKRGTHEYNDWAKLERKNFRYLATVVVRGNVQNVKVHDNNLLNNSVHAIGVEGTLHMNPDGTAPIPNLQTPEQYANGVEVYRNTISGGCRSGIYFVGGVVNSKMYNNLAINWGWAAFRFYYSTNNCEMYDNYSLVDTDVDMSFYENNDPNYVPTYFGVSYRVGHRTRGPGSCVNSKVVNNYAEYKGSHPFYEINETAYKALKVEILSKDTSIRNNTFNDLTTRNYDFNGFYDESGFCVIKSTNGIDFKNNKVYHSMPLGLHIQSSGNLNNNAKVVIDESNEFTSDDKRAVHIYCSKHSTYTKGANSVDFYIQNNLFKGNNAASILNIDAARNLYISNNNFKDVDLITDNSKSVDQAIVQSQNLSGVDVINNNTFDLKVGHNKLLTTIKGVSVSKGTINNNTFIVDKGTSIRELVKTGMRANATGHIRSQNNTYIELER